MCFLRWMEHVRFFWSRIWPWECAVLVGFNVPTLILCCNHKQYCNTMSVVGGHLYSWCIWMCPYAFTAAWCRIRSMIFCGIQTVSFISRFSKLFIWNCWYIATVDDTPAPPAPAPPPRSITPFPALHAGGFYFILFYFSFYVVPAYVVSS